MNLIPPPPRHGEIVYPESDGQPMADNSKQFQWIFVLAGNLAALFRERPDVFVSGNQNWYPVEGEPEEVQAPDVYVVFGRPKGHRSSYKQWEEDAVPMTVVFEILSPGNDPYEMARKSLFYAEHGVEEYYLYDPDQNRLQVFIRQGSALLRVRKVNGFASPRLGIRFELSGDEMVVYHPDGQRFRTFEELQAEYERERQERLKAEQRADQAQQRADQAEQRASRLALLSRKARRQEASAEELAELERLEEGETT